MDIKFRYPIVADRLVKSRKKVGEYTVYNGKHDTQVSPMSYQKIAGRPKKKDLNKSNSLKEREDFTYSTVTDLARFLGWSISVPLSTATW